MLSLYGHATGVVGFDGQPGRCVLRTRGADQPLWRQEDFALIRSEQDATLAKKYGRSQAVYIGEPEANSTAFERMVVLPEKFGYLADGDLVGFDPRSKAIRTHYRKHSQHNFFLVTERCNHYCLMCSQPPRDVDDRWILDEISQCIPLIDKGTQSLGFTGGEPFLDWHQFVGVLALCRDSLPRTAIHVLSNGRAFGRTEVVKAVSHLRHQDLMFGIAIYSAVDHVHDYVVQAAGAFDETVLGILKLKDSGQKVEVRVVLHAITARCLVETCQWLARNLPFVDHVALMGLENTGFAIANVDELWIDPLDYRSALAEGVRILSSMNVNVSVYNLQRCILDRSVWPHAIRSISDWKNAFLDKCETCVELDRCAGFFTTGRPRPSRGISRILA
jgi:His-Xaa-Ser system radical SAM maturase HxsC